MVKRFSTIIPIFRSAEMKPSAWAGSLLLSPTMKGAPNEHPNALPTPRRSRTWMRIQDARERPGKDAYKNYVSYAESLPATILMNGLGQACATLLAKAKGDLKDPHRLLYADLQSWLCGADAAAPFPTANPRLMEAIVQAASKRLLRAQTEALAYLVWLKKFANAYLERGKPGMKLPLYNNQCRTRIVSSRQPTPVSGSTNSATSGAATRKSKDLAAGR